MQYLPSKCNIKLRPDPWRTPNCFCVVETWYLPESGQDFMEVKIICVASVYASTAVVSFSSDCYMRWLMSGPCQSTCSKTPERVHTFLAPHRPPGLIAYSPFQMSLQLKFLGQNKAETPPLQWMPAPPTNLHYRTGAEWCMVHFPVSCVPPTHSDPSLCLQSLRLCWGDSSAITSWVPVSIIISLQLSSLQFSSLSFFYSMSHFFLILPLALVSFHLFSVTAAHSLPPMNFVSAPPYGILPFSSFLPV